MDLDGLITFLFLIFFFVLPSVLKIFSKKKKPLETAESEPENTKKTVLGKIGQQIQDLLTQLEEQSYQPEEKAKKPDLWDVLSEKDPESEADPEPEPWHPRDAPQETTGPDLEKDVPLDPIRAGQTIRSTEGGISPGTGPEKALQPRAVCHAASGGKLGQTPLQNVLIWSEVLGQPAGSKKNLFRQHPF